MFKGSNLVWYFQPNSEYLCFFSLWMGKKQSNTFTIHHSVKNFIMIITRKMRSSAV